MVSPECYDGTVATLQASNFAKRLRHLMSAARMTPRDLARAADVAEATVYRHLSGDRDEPRADTIRAYAEALNVSADELLGLAQPEPHVADADLVDVPLLGHASAGAGAIADAHIEEMIPTRLADIHTTPERAYWIRADGDSMIDAGIHPGSLLLVARGQEIEDGQIAVVLLEGEEAVVKRVYRDGGHLILASANSAYPPLHITGDARIIGKVVLIETRP